MSYQTSQLVIAILVMASIVFFFPIAFGILFLWEWIFIFASVAAKIS